MPAVLSLAKCMDGTLAAGRRSARAGSISNIVRACGRPGNRHNPATNANESEGIRQQIRGNRRVDGIKICQRPSFRTVLLSQLANGAVEPRRAASLAYAWNAAQHEQRARCRSAA